MRPFRAPWILGAETRKFDDEVMKARLEVVARLLKSRGGFAAFKGASLAMKVNRPGTVPVPGRTCLCCHSVRLIETS